LTKMKISIVLLLLISMIGVTACSKSEAGNAKDDKVKLTFWSWGESDIPGFDKWLDQEVKRYEEAKPNITIEVVKQSTDTLTSAFQATAQTNSGPDIATLWATLPVLSQAWSDYLVPMDDYVAKDEMSHWMSKQENEYEGKTWGMPIYMMSMVLAYNKELFAQAGLDPEKPIETWDQFLEACAKLKAKGITPIGMGNKNGYTGGWLFSTLGKQELDSINELKKAVIGQNDITSDKFMGWYTKYEELVAKGYFNDDISSLDLDNGWKLFPSGKAAMSWTSDGNYFNWLKQMGGDSKIGAMKTPVFGKGKLAQAGTATMSSAYVITKWSNHKQEAADFLTFLHNEQSLKDWYETTHAFPADDRFDASAIKDPAVKKVREWETTGEQIWPEIYLPPMVTENAEMVSGQIVSSKSGSMNEIKKAWKDVLEQWRSQHPDELANYEKWTK
jgi:raffinose/stachyose/melibiose transport system substrate-binding protein